MLSIQDIHAHFEKTEILKGLTLEVKKGEVHAIMGPNGSGKSTLAKVLAGHPSYPVSSGAIVFDGNDLLQYSPEERAQKGIFLLHQQPREISGVNFRQFLHTIHQGHVLYEAGKTLQQGRKDKDIRKEISPIKFRKKIEGQIPNVKLPKEFLERNVNEGFSGGEKKKSEILQMELLKPKIAVLDELDSGLDVDALRSVCEEVNRMKDTLGMGIILITHYPRILNYIHPNKVHLFRDGRIEKTGDIALAKEIEEKGYT
jgi:Fe-S cluster assembly ATP-binding protein